MGLFSKGAIEHLDALNKKYPHYKGAFLKDIEDMIKKAERNIDEAIKNPQRAQNPGWSSTMSQEIGEPQRKIRSSYPNEVWEDAHFKEAMKELEEAKKLIREAKIAITKNNVEEFKRCLRKIKRELE